MKEIKKPAFMQAACDRSGHPWLMEVFICIGIYLVGSILVGIGQMPGLMAYMLQNREYVRMLRTGEVDVELVMRLMQNMPEWFVIFVLFTEIILIVIYMLYCRFVERRKMWTMGFTGEMAGLQYGKGLFIGAAALTGAYLLCLVTGSAEFRGMAEDMVPAFIVLYFGGYMIQGMAEEVICRGFLMVSLSRRYSVWFSMVVSSLLFMSLHFLNEGITALGMVNLFLFGMFAALLFVESGNIWVVAAVHTIWNFLQGNVFGIQVSGLAKQNSIFATSFEDGRRLINGGSFGLEGGLAVTAVLAAGIFLTYFRMGRKGMLSEPASDVGQNQETAEDVRTADAAGEGGDCRVYRSDPSVFTETPWRPDTAENTAEGSRTTVFDADYFRIDGEEADGGKP